MSRPRWARLAVPVLSLAVAGSLTVVLARVPAGAAFVTTTSNGGDSVSAAPSFCVSPGTTTTLTPPQDDAYIDQANPDTNHYTGKLSVQPGSSVTNAHRAYIRFTAPGASLPTPPHDCSVTGATLRAYDGTPSAGRQIDVYRVDPTKAWSADTITWNNRATAITTGTNPVSASNAPASAGWQSWDVTSLVQTMYAYGPGGDNGFQLRDHREATDTTAYEQVYDDLLSSNPAQLVLTWG